MYYRDREKNGTPKTYCYLSVTKCYLIKQLTPLYRPFHVSLFQCYLLGLSFFNGIHIVVATLFKEHATNRLWHTRARDAMLQHAS